IARLRPALRETAATPEAAIAERVTRGGPLCRPPALRYHKSDAAVTIAAPPAIAARVHATGTRRPECAAAVDSAFFAIHWSWRFTSPALCHRSSGFFAKHVVMT